MRILRKNVNIFIIFAPPPFLKTIQGKKISLSVSLPTTALFSLRLQKKIVTFSIIRYELEWIIIILHVVQVGKMVI